MRYNPTKPKNYVDELKYYADSEEMENLFAQFVPTDLKNQYQVIARKECDQEYGRGGYREEITSFFLTKNCQVLILSICYDSWDTTSDDSTDYVRSNECRTYLLYDDPVAMLIFNALRAHIQLLRQEDKS